MISTLKSSQILPLQTTDTEYLKLIIQYTSSIFANELTCLSACPSMEPETNAAICCAEDCISYNYTLR